MIFNKHMNAGTGENPKGVSGRGVVVGGEVGGAVGGKEGGGGVSWRRNPRLLLLPFYVIPFSKHLGTRIQHPNS
jgi:hypothetical protein